MTSVPFWTGVPASSVTVAVSINEPSGDAEAYSAMTDFVGAVRGTAVQPVVRATSDRLEIAQARQDARNPRAIIRKQA